MNRNHATWVIVLSFIVAATLAVLPLPAWLDNYRPEWVVMVLLYWVIALPHRIGMTVAWVVGFFVDVLEGSMLGLNALVLTLTAYVALSLYQRLRMFSVLQQSSTVLMLVGISQLLAFWILTASNQNTASNLLFMAPALSSALLWPWVFLLLRKLRRSFQVS